MAQMERENRKNFSKYSKIEFLIGSNEDFKNHILYDI